MVLHWRSSSFQAVWFPGVKFEIEVDLISGYWYIQLLIFWGCLPLEVKNVRKIRSVVVEIFNFNILRLSFIVSILILVWSPKLKFKIWGKSDQLLLQYSSFNILRSSSIIGGCLYLNHFWFWFGPLSLCLNLRKIQSVVAERFNFNYSEVIFH